VEALGLTCVLAEDGIAAAELLEDPSEEFHLVITDFRMPRASGWWVIEAARLHRGASFPVIMQTAEAQYADVYAKAEALGVLITLRMTSTRSPRRPRGVADESTARAGR
jgi:CheY-like chemotaxis protein